MENTLTVIANCLVGPAITKYVIHAYCISNNFGEMIILHPRSSSELLWWLLTIINVPCYSKHCCPCRLADWVPGHSWPGLCCLCSIQHWYLHGRQAEEANRHCHSRCYAAYCGQNVGVLVHLISAQNKHCTVSIPVQEAILHWNNSQYQRLYTVIIVSFLK